MAAAWTPAEDPINAMLQTRNRDSPVGLGVTARDLQRLSGFPRLLKYTDPARGLIGISLMVRPAP
jgi:hypothetical protein